LSTQGGGLSPGYAQQPGGFISGGLQFGGFSGGLISRGYCPRTGQNAPDIMPWDEMLRDKTPLDKTPLDKMSLDKCHQQ